MRKRIIQVIVIIAANLVVGTKVYAAPPLCTPVLSVANVLVESNDTVVVCQFQLFDLIDESLLEGLLVNRTFDFGNGSGPFQSNSSSQYSYSYETEGVYTMTLTVESALCAEMSITKTVVVLGQPQFTTASSDVDCAGNCNGQASVELLSDASSFYSVQWNDQQGQVNDTAFNLCAGTYNGVITDQYGCTDLMTNPVDVFEPQPFTVEIALADTINLCPDNGVTGIPLDLQGGAGNNQAMWTVSPFVNVPSPELMELEPTETSLDQWYHVTVMDANACSGEDSIYVRSTPSSLMGYVTSDGQPCVSCDVIRYKYSGQPGVWVALESTLTDASGIYDFGAVPNFQKFILMADPEDVAHPMGVETFYPQKYDWDQADVFNMCGDDYDKHIPLIPPMEFNGTNTLSGTVFYVASGKTQTEEDPIPLIDVVVEKTPPGQAQGRVQTDEYGYYEFEYVPNSDTTYTIFVNIPGVPQTNTYEILADEGGEFFGELNFCLNIDSTALETCSIEEQLVTGELQESNNESFRLYPNPSNGMFSIETGKFADNYSQVRIIDPMGRVVFDKQYVQTPYIINMVNVAEGYYVVQMLNEKESDASGISVIRY